MAGGNSKDAAVAAVEASRRKPLERLTLANGIVLKFKPVPPYLVRQAAANVKRPEVPRVFIEDKGREEENPNDPAYIEALTEYVQEMSDAGTKVVLLAGTEVESVPEGMFWPQDDGWFTLVEYLGVKVEKDNQLGRYLDYLYYYALTSGDITYIWRAQRNEIGLVEEEVQAAASSFPNRAARRRAGRVPSEAAGQRDNVSTPSA